MGSRILNLKPRKLNHHEEVYPQGAIAETANRQQAFGKSGVAAAVDGQPASGIAAAVDDRASPTVDLQLIEDMLGRMPRQFIEQLLVMTAESVAGPKHPGCQAGDIRWHGRQSGTVNLGTSKLKVSRPRLRGSMGEVALPGNAAMAGDGTLSPSTTSLPPSV